MWVYKENLIATNNDIFQSVVASETTGCFIKMPLVGVLPRIGISGGRALESIFNKPPMLFICALKFENI